MQKSYSEFEYYAAGRKNCFYGMFKIWLKRRHCLLTNHVVDTYLGNDDTLRVEIPFDLKGRELPLEFLVIPKKDLKPFYQTHFYAENMLRSSNAKNLKYTEQEQKSKSSLLVMSEHDEITSQIITQSTGALLKKGGDHNLIKQIHVTDQKVYNGFPLMMVATFNIPKIGDTEAEEISHKLMLMCFDMVDDIANIKHSSTV